MPQSKALEKLLAEDPLGTLFRRITEAGKRVEAEILQHEGIAEVEKALVDTLNNQERAQELRSLDFESEAGLRKAADFLRVKFEDLKAFIAVRKRIGEVINETANLPAQKRSWKALLRTSSIQVIDKSTFPAEDKRPFIVFYSADWCKPCQLTKPTFARLSRFFEAAKLFYTSDEELAKREGVAFFPQLRAYLPSGAIVHAQCGSTTQELWDTMDALIFLGQSFDGEGKLICTEGAYRIEPTR